jgi:hypothetical protein
MQHFDEHFDDHQFELAGALSERRQAVMVTDLSAKTLIEAIEQVTYLEGGVIGETGLHATLRFWLAEQAAQPLSRRLGLFRRKCRGG